MKKLETLKPDLAGALARLGASKRDRAFPIPTSFHGVERKRETLKRKDKALVKRFIDPKNARAVLQHLPKAEGDRLHAVIAGDFIFCDLLLAIAKAHPGVALAVATLSLSLKNLQGLVAALDAGHLSRLELILSHYFQSTSRELFAAIDRLLGERDDAAVVTARTHCKIALFTGAGLVPLVIESSANLRSSGNLEQLTAFADTDLHAFHRGIFDQIVKEAA